MIPKATPEELDQIYQKIDDLMRQHRLAELDAFLDSIDVGATATDLLLGYLTASLPVKSRLPSRSKLVSAVEGELQKRKEWGPGLLAGLE